MRQKLDKKWAAFLLTLPESGMGYQRIDLFFVDGSMLHDIVAYNAEEIEIPSHYSNKEITKIQMRKSGIWYIRTSYRLKKGGGRWEN